MLPQARSLDYHSFRAHHSRRSRWRTPQNLCLSFLITILAVLIVSGCDADSESETTTDSGTEMMAGDVAGEAAGDSAGDESGNSAGDDAGDSAGNDAGDMAGEMSGDMAGMDEPLPPEWPLIRRVRAYINRQDGGLGLQIDGRDEDNDVVGFSLQYFFDDGEPLVLTEDGGPITLIFSELRQGNGDFVGVWSVPFLLDLNVDLLSLAEVSVTILDGAEHESRPYRIMLLDTPTVDDGEQCDLNRGLSRCGDDSLCGTAAGGRNSCSAAVLECPDYFEVIDLNAEGGQYDGDTSGRATYGVGSCGGGTSSQLFSFTADQDGTHSFIAEPTGVAPTFMGVPDTLMWIRSHCAFSDWNAELGCNDDINRAVGDLGSRIDLEMTSGQTVYIFVDGYSNFEQQMEGWSGPFTLEVSSR